MNIINLTPHRISLPNGRDVLPSGYISRLNVVQSQVDILDGVPILESQAVKTVNLPEVEQDTYYIVPALVRCAMPGRRDLLSPSKLLRDAMGQIIGCAALERNPKI